MTQPSPVLRQYRLIASISSQMLTQARSNRWELVLALGEQYLEAVESLRIMSHLSRDDRLARHNLLAQILDDDASIRDLAAPELKRLGTLLGQMRRKKALSKAYGARNSPGP